tara:strand:- start:5525 stop:6367 length:843 start_codon:yes stop_codon:yes gene_type:complete
MKPSIEILNEEIRLRPSAIDGFFGCAWQWGSTFLEGNRSMPSSRAAIGTSIHAAAEQMWQESIKAGDKRINLSAMTDAAMGAWKVENEQDNMQFNEGETQGTCAAEIIAGTEAFIEDIVPFTSIPTAVEQFFKVDIKHALVSELGGTVDYINHNTIADIKTGKRKPTVANYSTQQSIYKYLAIENGIDVKHNLIQSVVLKKVPEGMILPMEANVPQAKVLVNMILDTLDLVMKDVAPIETILRPNTGYMFCSQKFCAFYGKCPGTIQKIRQPTTIAMTKL